MPSSLVVGVGKIGTKGCESLTSLAVSAMRCGKSAVDSAIVKDTDAFRLEREREGSDQKGINGERV